MLTTDFIKAVEKIGLEVDNGYSSVLYVESHDGVVVSINKGCSEAFTWCEGRDIHVGGLLNLIPLVEEYANTPIEEREKKVSEKLDYETIKEYIFENMSENDLARLLSELLIHRGETNTSYVITNRGVAVSPKFTYLD